MIIETMQSRQSTISVKDVPAGHVFKLCESGAVGLSLDHGYYIFLEWAKTYTDQPLGDETMLLHKKDDNPYQAIDLGRLKSIDKITVII